MRNLLALMIILPLFGCGPNASHVDVDSVKQWLQLDANTKIKALNASQLSTFEGGEYRRNDTAQIYVVQITPVTITINNDVFKVDSGSFESTELGSIMLCEINGEKCICCLYCYEHFYISTQQDNSNAEPSGDGSANR